MRARTPRSNVSSAPKCLTWTISATPAPSRPRRRDPGLMSSNASTTVRLCSTSTGPPAL
jgi:hypothetical protein